MLYFLIQDPLMLSEKAPLLPQQLIPLLGLMDGTREDSEALSVALSLRLGIRIPATIIEKAVSALDNAFMLENVRFKEACETALKNYRNSKYRPPSLAGLSYPEDRDELRLLFDGYNSEEGDPDVPPSKITGLISPHIDFTRGGPVYAKVWRSAKDAARAADLVIIFGTDHYGAENLITLTRQKYATPFGEMPPSIEIIDRLAAVDGEINVFADELHHRDEHSIELALTWLQYAREGNPCEIVPVLCGPFAGFILDESDPADDPIIDKFICELRKAIRGRKALVIAAGDLSHVGPAFNGAPVLDRDRTALKELDGEMITHICRGDATGFFYTVSRFQDQTNVCGVSPIYLAMRTMGNVTGIQIAYDQCPADQNHTSFVSICGVVFTRKGTKRRATH